MSCCSVNREDNVFESENDLIYKIFRLDKGVVVTWSCELSEEGKNMSFASPGDTH